MRQPTIGPLDQAASDYLRSQVAKLDARARGEYRADANETGFLPRDLLAEDPRNYQEMFAGILGRRYFPLAQGISPNMMQHSYKMWRLIGQAKGGTDATTEVAQFSAVVSEKLGPIEAIPGMYSWTVDEINAARELGNGLDEMTVLSAHAGLERAVDNRLALGNAAAGYTGALNNADVDSTTVITGSWGTATAQQILDDIFKMVSETLEALNQAAEQGGQDAPAFTKFTLLIPVKQDMLLKKPRSTTSDTSIKAWLLQNLDNIEAIEPWWQCKGRGSGAT